MDQDQYGAAVRRHLTSFNSFDNYIYQRTRLGCHSSLRDQPILQPHFNHLRFVSIPKASSVNPADGICAHFLIHGFNRVQKSPIIVGYNAFHTHSPMHS